MILLSVNILNYNVVVQIKIKLISFMSSGHINEEGGGGGHIAVYVRKPMTASQAMNRLHKPFA